MNAQRSHDNDGSADRVSDRFVEPTDRPRAFSDHGNSQAHSMCDETASRDPDSSDGDSFLDDEGLCDNHTCTSESPPSDHHSSEERHARPSSGSESPSSEEVCGKHFEAWLSTVRSMQHAGFLGMKPTQQKVSEKLASAG